MYMELVMVTVTTVFEQMNAGTTSPMLVEDVDHKRYIMKYIHDGWEGKFLFNELISARMAEYLELPIPAFEIGDLSRSLISNNDVLSSLNAKSGSVFLSEYRKGITIQNDKILAHAKNKKKYGNIIFFDQLLNNVDRGENEGNWFFDQKTHNLMIFDHTHVFRIGQLWDQISLQQDQNLPMNIRPEFSESLYLNILNNISENTPFYGITRKLARLNDIGIEQMLQNIPAEWEILPEDMSAMEQFLKFQVDNATTIEGLLNTHLKWVGK